MACSASNRDERKIMLADSQMHEASCLLRDSSSKAAEVSIAEASQPYPPRAVFFVVRMRSQESASPTIWSRRS